MELSRMCNDTRPYELGNIFRQNRYLMRVGVGRCCLCCQPAEVIRDKAVRKRGRGRKRERERERKESEVRRARRDELGKIKVKRVKHAAEERTKR